MLLYANLYSQESSLNLYSNWSYFPNMVINHIDNGDSKLGYSGLSFSYRRVNENLNFQEYELKSGVRFTSYDESKNKRIYNHIRYEIGKQNKNKIFNKFDLQYGLGFRLFHFYNEIDPQVADSFRSDEHKIGFSTALIANLKYDISRKFYAQLKVSLIDFTIAGGISEAYRPDLPRDQQTNWNIDIDYFGEQSLRLGIGYKIGAKRKS